MLYVKKKQKKHQSKRWALRALMSVSVSALVSKLPDPPTHIHHFCEITSSSGKNIKKGAPLRLSPKGKRERRFHMFER